MRSILFALLLHTNIHRRRLILVGCCVFRQQSAASEANMYFIFRIFSLINSTVQMMGRRPPMRSRPLSPPLSHPP